MIHLKKKKKKSKKTNGSNEKLLIDTLVEIREGWSQSFEEMSQDELCCVYATMEMTKYLIEGYPTFLNELMKREFMKQPVDGVRLGEGIATTMAHVLYICSDCYLFEKLFSSDQEIYFRLLEFKTFFRTMFTLNYPVVLLEGDYLEHLTYKFESKLMDLPMDTPDDPSEALGGTMCFNLMIHAQLDPALIEWLMKKDYVQTYYTKLVEIKDRVKELRNLSESDMEQFKWSLINDREALFLTVVSKIQSAKQNA